MGYRDLVIADGAIAYWRLDETSGTTAVDAIAGAAGTIAPGVALGQSGALSGGNTAMRFDGITGKVACPALAIPAAYTVEAWIKTTAAAPGNYYPILSNRLGSTPAGMFLFAILDSKLVMFHSEPIDQIGSARAIADGAWHHVVCAATGTQVALYIDGTPDNAGALAHSARTLGVNIAHDANSSPGFLAATIDEVAIYPVALSAAQIAAHFAASRVAVSPAHREGCARLGRMRLNAARLNVFEPWAAALIGSGFAHSGPGTGLRIEGASIDQILNDQTDTARFRARGVPSATAGQPIQVYSGDFGVEHQLFGGRIIAATQVYEGRTENAATDLQCVDPTWLLNRRTVLARYAAQSATAIVLDLITRFARGVTVRNVAPGLPLITAITFTNEYLPVCLTAICERIGGHWYQDYQGDLHLFLSETPDANAITDAAPHGAVDLQLTEDLSQVATKIIGRGGGARAAVETPAGATELPVDEGVAESWYSASGGLVETGAQVLTYAGMRGRGGLGAFLGTGNAPSGAPRPTPAAGSSHAFGATYRYAATFTTASGETQPGPLGSILVQNLVMPPPLAVSARSRGAGSFPAGLLSPGGSSFRFMLQISYGGGAMGPGGAISPSYAWDGNDWEIYIGPAAPVAGGGVWYPAIETSFVAPVSSIMVHRSDNGGPWLGQVNYLPSTYAGSAAGWWGGNCAGYTGGGGPYPLPSTGTGAVNVLDVPKGTASGITGRRIYRTAANGSALKLLTAIANNSATTYLDTIADAALGAAPPASDTSGVKDEGQVLPGATSIPVSSSQPFTDDVGPGGGGGWARVGAMPVRYAGIAAGVLTGIPASGNGAITAATRYGTQVLVQPRLVGIPPTGTGAIVDPILRGDVVMLRIEKLDAAARDVMANKLIVPGQPLNTDDGIIEIVVSDSRFGLVELQAHVDATLLDRKDPHLTLRFDSRDLSLQVGRLITVNTSAPPIAGTFRIAKIGLSQIAITGGRAMLHPLKHVEASSKIYKFTDLLRRLRSVEAGAH